MGTTVNKEGWRFLGACLCGKRCCRMVRQAVDRGDIARVVEALRSDWLTTGPRVAGV